jgi:hypothetical protein
MKNSIHYLVLIFLITAQNSYTQPVVTGSEYRDASSRSIDIFAANLLVLQGQEQAEEGGVYLSATSKIAPIRSAVADGTLQKGSLFRMNVPFGFYRKYDNGFMLFSGFNIDAVAIDGDYNITEDMPWSGQVLLHCGFGFPGIQFQAAYIGTVGFWLDGNGEFNYPGAYTHSRDSSKGNSSNKSMYTIYHKSGIFLSAIIDTTGVYNKFTSQKEGEKKKLSEMRLNLQPIKSTETAIKRPLLEFTKLDRNKVYYNEYNKVAETKDPLELRLGTDGFFLEGLSFSASSQVSPKVLFRAFEISYCHTGDAGLIGAKGLIYNRLGNPELSYEVFAMLFGKKAGITITYGYNLPDALTFVPIPRLHVFGMQYYLGNPKTARQLIPNISHILMDKYLD